MDIIVRPTTPTSWWIGPAQLIELKSGSWRDKDRLDVAAMTEILRLETEAAERPPGRPVG
jgi:hypothetical protein